MALITGGSIENGAIVGLTPSSTTKGGYFDQRTKPDDETKTQVREHETTETTYLGLSQAAAEALAGVYQTSSKVITRTSSPSGGGMYEVNQTIDIITTGVWESL